MKCLFLLLLAAILLAGCNKSLKCVSCIAQKNSGEIIDTRASCDKSGDFIKGFVDGFTSKYNNPSDSIRVLCK